MGAALGGYSNYYLKMDLYNSICFLTYKILLTKEIKIISGRFLRTMPQHPCEKQC